MTRVSVRAVPAAGAVLALVLILALGGCAAGLVEETTFDQIGDTVAIPDPDPHDHESHIEDIEVTCADGIGQNDCDQAVSAIVYGIPYGENVVEIEIRPLDEPLSVTPAPPWSASATARLNDGTEHELVITQDFRPGPMLVEFAPDD